MKNEPTQLQKLVIEYSQTKRTVQRQAYVARPGETPSHTLFVVKGKIRQFDTRPNGTEVTLNIYGRGALVALPWIFKPGPTMYSFRAMEDTIVIEIPIAVAREWLENDPTLSYETLSRLVRGFEGMYSRLLTHSGNDALDRIMTEIIIESRRFGVAQDGGVFIKLSSSELATRTGLARETASRMLSQMAADGLISRTKSGFLLHQKPIL